MSGFAFLLAPGAGAPSTHPPLQDFARLLAPFGAVQTFDYPYALAGRKRPDPLPRLIAAHREALDGLGGGRRVVLAGKSMGGRVGCHVALETPVAGPARAAVGTLSAAVSSSAVQSGRVIEGSPAPPAPRRRPRTAACDCPRSGRFRDLCRR